MTNEAMDKKQAKRLYKECAPAAGVMLIRNKRSGMLLLEASMNPQGLLNRHLFQLKFGQHRIKTLLADWQQDGESGFECRLAGQVKADAENIPAALAELLAAQQAELGVTESNTYR